MYKDAHTEDGNADAEAQDGENGWISGWNTTKTDIGTIRIRMEKRKDGENGWIDGWRRLEKYKHGHMKDRNMGGEVQSRQKWVDIWIALATEVQKQTFED